MARAFLYVRFDGRTSTASPSRLAPPPIRMRSVTTAPGPRAGAGRAAPGRGRYQARPGRSALVASDLADLRGPVAGTVELHLCQKHGESSVTTANFQNPAASGTQCVEMRGNLEKVA